MNRDCCLINGVSALFAGPSGTGKTLPVLPDVLAWSPDHGRAILFRDTGDKSYVFGIMTHVFEVVNETYSASVLYDIREGFEGFVNSTGWNEKAPIYYCPPHMYLVKDQGWRKNVTCMHELTAPRTHVQRGSRF